MNDNNLRFFDPEEHDPAKNEEMDDDSEDEVDSVGKFLNRLHPAIRHADNLDFGVFFDFLIGFGVFVRPLLPF